MNVDKFGHYFVCSKDEREMSVDKFGRHGFVVNREFLRGPEGLGFKLTKDSDYDMQTKKLRNVALPTADTDAATKEYVDYRSPFKESSSWKFAFKRLDEVADPINEGEAVNLRTLQSSTIIYNATNNTFDAQNRVIKHVCCGESDYDVANIKNITSACEDVGQQVSKHINHLQDQITHVSAEIRLIQEAIKGISKTIDFIAEKHDHDIRKLGIHILHHVHSRRPRDTSEAIAKDELNLNWDNIFGNTLKDCISSGKGIGNK